MQHLPVYWSEGLFLTAQHFQAAERHWAERLAQSEQFDQPYCYGIRSLKFSEAAIGNFSFQLDACAGRTRRGAAISFGEGEEPDRASLKEALDQKDRASERLTFDLARAMLAKGTVRVYLAIPKMRLGAANIGRRGEAGLHRYVEIPGISLQDENAGGNDQEVGFRQFNLRLIVKPARAAPSESGALQFDDDDPDFELLPIAQIRRGGETGPELDAMYIPPILACDAWPVLQNGILQTIYDWIGNRIEILSQQVLIRRITLASQEPDNLDRLLMLMMLNRSYVTLGHLAFASGVHPFVAYGALLDIIGQLSIFDPKRRPPPDIPRYDHDDLGTIFYWVMNRLKLLLALQPDVYFFRPFEGRGLGMHVTFEPEWLGAGFKWYVGVHYEHVTAVECRALLAPNKLHWKLGSARQVEGLFQGKKPGLILTAQENAPKELPAQNYIYFEVSRAGDAWQDVVSSQTLAMRYQDSLVDNKASLEGQRTLIIHHPPKKVELQFGLFAVPSRP